MTDLVPRFSRVRFRGVISEAFSPIQHSAVGKSSQTSAWIALQYRDNKNVSFKMYLPADEVPEASVELKQRLFEEESKSTDWLQSNYMHSRMRKCLHKGVVIQSPALFP